MSIEFDPATLAEMAPERHVGMSLRILAYASVDPETPPHLRGFAMALVQDQGKLRLDLVHASAETPEGAAEKLRAFYSAEEQRLGALKPRGRRPKPAPECSAQDEDSEEIV